MAKTGPIILVEDCIDDQEMVSEALAAISIPNKLVIKNNGAEALEYLRTTEEKPFLILCDVNMPKMNGLSLRHEINEDARLRRKSIPFVFYSTAAVPKDVREAYDLTVQGFFVKGATFPEIVDTLKLICDYWASCKHPNS